MAQLPAGMRNNNPGNIKFIGQKGTRPSKNTDQGDPQAVYASPQAGMNAMWSLLQRKYSGGKVTPMMMIAGKGGWTPGNTQAAQNVAKYAGIGVNDDINFADPASAAKFMRALMLQEHGQASLTYTDDMIRSSIGGGGGGGRGGDQTLAKLAYKLYGGAAARPDSVSGFNPAFHSALAQLYAAAAPEIQRELGITSGYRSKAVQQALWDASDKTGRTVARPGKSHHNFGTAADLYGMGLGGKGNLVSDATKNWVHQNAGQFGLYFPMSYEPWHIQLKGEGQGGDRRHVGGAGSSAANFQGDDTGTLTIDPNTGLPATSTAPELFPTSDDDKDNKLEDFGGLLAAMAQPQQQMAPMQLASMGGGGGGQMASLPEYIQQYLQSRLIKPPGAPTGGQAIG